MTQELEDPITFNEAKENEGWVKAIEHELRIRKKCTHIPLLLSHQDTRLLTQNGYLRRNKTVKRRRA